ncbi:prephenate dehydratase [Lactococcus kimchii]|uniref:prephenate dehydratase n=1 Tax=Lactococcus sp. S-13 TaxID=2507158 RepID=UPI0010234041|nr:prephenate dehydratase [Lactococcus sp. S-13]RZI48947.1 prephenate dehydratase [Lactococcus sp. S-13]
MKIAYLGPRGSFCSVVAEAAFKTDELIAYETIIDVIEAYDEGKCDFALIPIENSTEGTVNMSIDKIFHDSEAQVVAEFVLPISQNLLAISQDRVIERVYSHPQALAQTRAYLRKFYPEAQVEITASTSAAAEFVKKHPELPVAAVANRYAAKRYDLAIVAENIQDVAGNSTRFWLLGEQKKAFNLRQAGEKMSLALTLPENLPGALHKAISVFAWRDIDMTKIESRPLKTRLGQYFFIIDLVNNELNAAKIPFALEELASLGVSARVLGNYAFYSIEEM